MLDGKEFSQIFFFLLKTCKTLKFKKNHYLYDLTGRNLAPSMTVQPTEAFANLRNDRKVKKKKKNPTKLCVAEWEDER